MARDDFFVIAYRILAYLYACMKAGEDPDMALVSSDKLEISRRYWNSVMGSLVDKGYVRGVKGYKIPDGHVIYEPENPEITMDGIEFLQSNTTLAKAKAFLKELKEIVPGL